MLKATKTKQYILMICPSQLALKNPWSMDNIKNIWVINSIIHFWKEILHLVVFLEWCGKGLTSKRETVVILHSTEEVILSNSMFLVKYTWAWCPGAWLVHLVTLHWKKNLFFFVNTYLQQKSPWFGMGICVLFPCSLWAFLSGAVCSKGIAFGLRAAELSACVI